MITWNQIALLDYHTLRLRTLCRVFLVLQSVHLIIFCSLNVIHRAPPVAKQTEQLKCVSNE
jgi:hypothetical protein